VPATTPPTSAAPPKTTVTIGTPKPTT
jgi:hypothetical protein